MSEVLEGVVLSFCGETSEMALSFSGSAGHPANPPAAEHESTPQVTICLYMASPQGLLPIVAFCILSSVIKDYEGKFEKMTIQSWFKRRVIVVGDQERRVNSTGNDQRKDRSPC